MVNENKSNVFAAVAGVVVGAGAVLASVIALKDKGNQKKINDLIATARDTVRGYKDTVADVADDSKESVKKMANKAIDKAEQVTKSAKKEVKKI